MTQPGRENACLVSSGWPPSLVKRQETFYFALWEESMLASLPWAASDVRGCGGTPSALLADILLRRLLLRKTTGRHCICLCANICTCLQVCGWEADLTIFPT